MKQEWERWEGERERETEKKDNPKEEKREIRRFCFDKDETWDRKVATGHPKIIRSSGEKRERTKNIKRLIQDQKSEERERERESEMLFTE